MMSSLLDQLAAGAAVFGQSARLIRLRFTEGSGFDGDVLIAHRLHGEEALSQGYRYTLDCLSIDAHLELKRLLGQPVEIGLRLADGGERLCCGLVLRAEQSGADGGFARYRLTVQPALASLQHRRNSRVFQDKTVPEIVATVLDEHMATTVAFTRSFGYQLQLDQPYPRRSYTLQYRESDLAFIERLLSEEGISYRYGHGPDPDIAILPAGGGDDSATPLHTLILFDNNHALAANAQSLIRFHRSDGVEAEDAIDLWRADREIQTGATQLASYDYQAVDTLTAADTTRIDHGGDGGELALGLEDYDPQAGYYAGDRDELTRYARLRQQARDAASKRFEGEGSARSLYPGTWFELAEHPIHDRDAPTEREFLVTALSFSAENNLLPPAAPGAATGANPPYRNRILALRRQIPVVPEFSAAHRKPRAYGLTTATVVGPAGEEIFTDEHGRIRVQFHWQRPQDHPEGGAAMDERASTWIRVAMPSAGAQWGTQYIPRIGQEVLIDFIEGDIDRPLVTGVVYNGRHRPPTFSGAGQLPANKALSGIKSKEYKGSGYNELLFDDSAGQLRAKLSSEHGKTQLNQGFLIHPRTDGKGEPRGEGFELRTDHHGALRAGQGLLLSTEAQAGATGRQLARDPAQAQLDAALALARNLGEAATAQGADTLEHGPAKIGSDNGDAGPARNGHLHHHAEALRAWEAGSNTNADGTQAKEASGRQPLLVLTSPAGIASTSAQSQTHAAGTNLDLVAQRDTNQTSGRRWLHNVGEHISLFVQGVRDTVALKLITARGKLQLQAQSDSIELTADQHITLTANQGRITLTAKEEILLTAGGGYIRIAGGNIEVHCPGLLSSKGSSHQIDGPDSMSVTHPAFPQHVPKQALTLGIDQAHQGLGNGWAGMPYTLYADGAQLLEGVFDGSGALPIEHAVPTQAYVLELANGMRYEVPVAANYTKPEQGTLANLGLHKRQSGQEPDTGATPATASARENYYRALQRENDEAQHS